jgi:adenosylmethionine-8-amino-7-oxononanoate aminotransferase
LEKVGHRSPRAADNAFIDNGESIGIPGSDRPVLFYQQRHNLPVVSHGEGIYLFDTNGKRYLDGCSGAVSANLGHGNKRVIDAAIKQLEQVAFAYRLQFENQPANELADLLVRLSPPELNRVFFVNSGSEAVEAAIKLARQFWWATGHQGKSRIISRQPSYHGATLGALSCTGYSPLNIPFQAMTMHSPRVSAPFCYHCPLGKTYPECEMACAWELERAIATYGPDNIAAFIAEPIGGSTTGAAVPPEEYFPIIEKICHDHDILLILDDVMVGCGRTGTFFGYEHWDITPDIVASSKGLSAGYTPLGAIVASDAVVDPVLERGGFMHGHTYAGNPLSAAIALEAVRTILDEDLLENARDVGTYMHERLHELKDRYPVIGDVRGRGLFAGVEFIRGRAEREPFPVKWAVAYEATEIARAHGLLLYPRRSLFGLSGDHVLIAPPLIIDRKGVDEMIGLFDLTLQELTALVERFLRAEAAELDDRTVQRFHQAEDLPDYAIGDLSEVEPAADANVTASMETGQTCPLDMPIDADTTPPRDGEP